MVYFKIFPARAAGIPGAVSGAARKEGRKEDAFPCLELRENDLFESDFEYFFEVLFSIHRTTPSRKQSDGPKSRWSHTFGYVEGMCGSARGGLWAILVLRCRSSKSNSLNILSSSSPLWSVARRTEFWMG